MDRSQYKHYRERRQRHKKKRGEEDEGRKRESEIAETSFWLETMMKQLSCREIIDGPHHDFIGQ